MPYSPGLLTAIRALYERAGITAPPHPIHGLRHTFGTTMAAGVPLPVLQELMGHADVKTTRRYIHVGEQEKRAAIASAWQQLCNHVEEQGKPAAMATAWPGTR